MTEKLQTIIKEEVAKLPPHHQKALASLDWVQISENIGEKNSLSFEEINDLQVEILLVLIGITDPELFESSIEDEVGLTAEDAARLSNEIFTKIFIPINDSLSNHAPSGFQTEIMGPQKITANDDRSVLLEEVSRANKLNVEQMAKMEEVVSSVTTGAAKAEDMTALLIEKLSELPEEKVISLSKDINEKVLRKIREDLRAETSWGINIEDEAKILGTAGIELVTENPAQASPKTEPKKDTPTTPPALPKEEPKTETLPVVQELELTGKTIPPSKAVTPPVFAQKLGGVVQTPSVKTEHSPENDQAPTPTPKSYPKGQDPYRLPPI